MIWYALSLVLGFFIGSFPSAYLLVKWKTRLDIREEGSGNVGAMNAWEVSRSRIVGLMALMLDLLKGMFAVWLAGNVFGEAHWIKAAGGLGAVLGHNYSPWLRGRGGRGLAPAAGVMLLLGWVYVFVWCVLWLVTFIPSRHIHLSNIVALLVSPIIMLLFPEGSMRLLGAREVGSPGFMALVMILTCILLLRHVQPIASLWKSFTQKTT